MRASAVLGLFGCALTVGCAERAVDSAGRAQTPVSVDTVVTTASALIGEVSDLLVAPSGTLYVVDVQAHAVHAIDSAGVLTRTIGRAGQGPGEFNRPTSLLMLGDTLGVVDSDNGRLQLLDASGTVLGIQPLPGGYPPPVVFRTRMFARPTLTLDTTLAAIHGSDLSVRARVGHSVGPASNLVRPGEMKAQIQRGEVPQIFLNTATTMWGSDGSLFLVVPARATVERFDSVGTPLWAVTVEDSLFPQVMAEFVRRNAGDERRFTPLRYVLATREVGGELWLLLGQSAFGPAAVLVLDAQGREARRLTFPQVVGVSNFAVDLARRSIYFSTAESAAVVRTGIPTV